jgi:hypothetical protein
MSTVMTDGTRRCDDNCHHARGSKCGCICGGKFHGANVVSTKETERKELEELIAKSTVKKAEPARVLADSEDQPRLMFVAEENNGCN